MNTQQKRSAFSLVELVIVVVIIGVIAAIAVPRISRGAKGAGESALRGSLASLRNSIDMYAAEHGGAWPAADGVEATLLRQLTEKTDASGAAGGTLGPYLRRGFPPCPVGARSGDTGVQMTNATPLAVVEGTAGKGWVYNYATGEVIVNCDDPDEGGTVNYDAY
jgi:prepilin-type N-terminal cleavage/methylation domain-containing protein